MAAPKYITITAEEANSKLLSVLQNRLAEKVPRSALMKWIRTGQIRLESKRTKPFRRVEYGQTLRLPPQAQLKSSSSAPSPQSDPLHRVAETPNLLVVAKPAGLPMHPGSKHRASLTQYIAQAYPHTPWPPQPVHRLDKATSGLILAAKRVEIFQELQMAWHQGEIGKYYLAWLVCREKQLPTTWQTWRDRVQAVYTSKGEKMACVPQGGKEAVLHIRGLWVNVNGTVLALIQLETGRKHQIRVQAASRGMAVLGETKYGHSPNQTGLYLHAWRLTFRGADYRFPPPWTGPYSIEAGTLEQEL